MPYISLVLETIPLVLATMPGHTEWPDSVAAIPLPATTARPTLTLSGCLAGIL